MKSVWRNFKIGIVVLIPIFVCSLLAGWAWSLLSETSPQFLDSKLLNFLITIGIILVAIYFIGWCVSLRWFRRLISFFGSKIPLIGPIIEFFLNDEYIERIKRGDLSEVMFRMFDGYGFGFVTGEFRAPSNPISWNLRVNQSQSDFTDWCLVLGPPTTPLAITAQLLFFRKADLIFTGRTAKDTSITTATFGFMFDLPVAADHIQKGSVA